MAFGRDPEHQALIAQLKTDPAGARGAIVETYQRLSALPGPGKQNFFAELLTLFVDAEGPTDAVARALFDALWEAYGEPARVDWPAGAQKELAQHSLFAELRLAADTGPIPEPESFFSIEDGQAFRSRIDRWLLQSAERHLPEDDRRKLILFETSLGRDTTADLDRVRDEIARRHELLGPEHPGTIRAQIVLARVHVNRGQYEEGATALEDLASSDPRAQSLIVYGSQLAGCVAIIVGEVRKGLELLERVRRREEPPEGTLQGYSKTLSVDDRVHRLAVGLLECFVFPSNNPFFGAGYYHENTLSSLRRLATELKKAGKPEAAAAMRKMRRLWAEQPKPDADPLF